MEAIEEPLIDDDDDPEVTHNFLWNLFIYSLMLLCLSCSIELLQRYTQLPFKSQFQDYYTKPILFCLADIVASILAAIVYPFAGMHKTGIASLSTAILCSIGMLYLQDRNKEYLQNHKKSELAIETM